MNDRPPIVQFLQPGESHAIPAGHLANLLHTDTRRLRDYVKAARRQGWPICSTNSGYFLPSSNAEFKQTLHKLHSQAVSLLATERAMKESWNNA